MQAQASVCKPSSRREAGSAGRLGVTESDVAEIDVLVERPPDIRAVPKHSVPWQVEARAPARRPTSEFQA